MKPIRVSDLAFRGMLRIYSMFEDVPVTADEQTAIDTLLNEEARTRGYLDWHDAAHNYNVHAEIANDATPFQQVANERAIAIRALRKIEKHENKNKRANSTVDLFAHAALDEIGDDRSSDL